MGPHVSLTPEQRSTAITTVLLNAMASMSSTTLFLSVPYLASALGLTQEEQLWPADAFLIAMICVPLFSGNIASRFGHRNLLLACISGTCITAILCGLAPGIVSLTLLCVMLGAFSGPIAPTTQANIVARFPSESRGTAMSIWGTGTTAGVLAGALASGFLIEHFTWRIAFAAGIPLGLLALPILLRTHNDPSSTQASQTDRAGLVLLCTMVLSFGITINLGDNFGWFTSPVILTSVALCILSLLLFLRHYRNTTAPIISFAPLRRQRFTLTIMISLGIAMFTTGQFQTDMLGSLLHDSPELVSLRSLLGGVAMTLGVLLGGRILRHFQPATVILFSLFITLLGKSGCLLYAPGMNTFEIIWPQMVSGFGLGFLSPALAVIAFDGLDGHRTGDAAGIYVLAGRMGSALGIAVLGVVFDQLVLHDALRQVAANATPSLQEFLNVFTLELVGFALLLPATLLLIRAGRKKQIDKEPQELTPVAT